MRTTTLVRVELPVEAARRRTTRPSAAGRIFFRLLYTR